MRKRFRVGIAILLLAVVGGLAWQGLRPREPAYQGKTLSWWLDNYYVKTPLPGGAVSSHENEEAKAAVRHMGTNAIPILMRMFSGEESPLTHRLLLLARKMRILSLNLQLKPLFISAAARKELAIKGFKVLGPEAKAAVPALIESYDRAAPRTGEQLDIAEAFARIGPPAKAAIPSLMRVATDTNNFARNTALLALVQIHGDPEKVVPMLAGFLNDPNRGIRFNAAHGLEKYGPEAKMAVPALIQSLGDEDGPVRKAVKEALEGIDPEAAAKAGVK